jgi:aspartyl-tRNA(Asn)/glutamyl-tRNA(Gln) amidotransferase subunit A
VAIDLSRLSAARIREGICAGDFTATDIVEAAIAFNQVTGSLAFMAAERVDTFVAERFADGEDPRETLPPLAGVPVAFKDNMNLRGTMTTCSSRILEDHVSVYDCTAVARMLASGVLPIGKCNMDEFAFGSSTENSAFGPTHNPWDLDRVPGGSSGGSAAAVAAGMVTLSLGSDTGGSIRQPGALTGTVAMKPTYGRVSRFGIVAFASSLDQIGPFSKTVGECAMALNVICGKDGLDATSVDRPAEDFAAGLGRGVEGLRVGLVRDLLELDGCDPRVRASVRDAVETLAGLGAEVGEVDLPSCQYGMPAYYIIGPAEASSNLARFDGVRYGRRAADPEDVMDLYLRSRAEGFGPESIRRIMLGTYALSAGYHDEYYGQAQKVRTLIIRDFERAFADFDVLITPTSPTTAFRIGEKASDPVDMYLSDVYTIPANLAGVPGLSVPCGLVDGLPVGLQIIGPHWGEATILRTGYALETALKLDMTPPIAKALSA